MYSGYLFSHISIYCQISYIKIMLFIAFSQNVGIGQFRRFTKRRNWAIPTFSDLWGITKRRNWAIPTFCDLLMVTKRRDWYNPIILICRNGIIPSRAAKPQVKELKILHESRKLLPNFPRMALQAWWNKNSPRAAKPRVGNFYFTTTAKPWVGNWD